LPNQIILKCSDGYYWTDWNSYAFLSNNKLQVNWKTHTKSTDNYSFLINQNIDLASFATSKTYDATLRTASNECIQWKQYNDTLKEVTITKI
jgi:hypothetical protein